MGTLVCPLCCGDSFSSQQSLRYHLLSVTDNVLCPGCDERFDTILSLADHLNGKCGKPDAEDDKEEILNCKEPENEHNEEAKEKQKQETTSDPVESTSTVSTDHSNQGNTDLLQDLHDNVQDNVTSDNGVVLEVKDGQTSLQEHKNESNPLLTSLVSITSASQDYTCSTCQTTFSSVTEHIQKYHLTQDIVVEMNLGNKETHNHEHGSELISTLEVDKKTAIESNEVSTNQLNILDSNIQPHAASLFEGKQHAVNQSEKSVVATSTESSYEMLTHKPLLAVRNKMMNHYKSNEKILSGPGAASATKDLSHKVNAEQFMGDISDDDDDDDDDDGGGGSSVLSCDESDQYMDNTSDDDDADSIILQYDTPALQSNEKQSPPSKQHRSAALKSLKMAQTGKTMECERKIVHIKKFWEESNYFKVQENRELIELNTYQGMTTRSDGCIPIVKMSVAADGGLKEVYECNKCVRQFSLQSNFQKHKCLAIKLLHCIKKKVDSSESVSSSEKDKEQVNSTEKDKEQVNNSFKNFSSTKELKKQMNNSLENVNSTKEFKKQMNNSLENVSSTKEVKKQENINCIRERFKKQKTVTTTRRIKRQGNVSSVTEGVKRIRKRKLNITERRYFMCETCNTKFSKINNFKMHKCRFCKECNTTFPRRTSFLKHIASVHSTDGVKANGPVTCEICNTVFPTERRFKLHRKMHEAQSLEKYSKPAINTEFKCDVCGTCCSTKRTLLQHMRIHNPEKVRLPKQAEVYLCSLVCKLCKKTFDSNEELQEHWKVHMVNNEEDTGTDAKKEAEPNTDTRTEEKKGDEQFVCNICGRSYDKSYKKEHMSLHIGQKLYPCDICKKKFHSHNNLMIHKHIHTGKEFYTCPHCKKSYRHANGFKAHLLLHMGKQPYACGFCNQHFSRPHEKVKHERIHTGEKPHTCPVCGNKFRIAYSLTLHMRVHTGIRPYICKVCDKAFKTQTCLVHHSTTHSDVRAYTCSYCSKSYKTVRQLRNHENSHTKPISCTECPLRFASPSAVRRHMKCHTNSVKFCCNICGAFYGKQHVLRNHMKTHSKNETDDTLI